jgi:hyaluronoglucosaminidase|nr:MAG TPA: nucleoid-associated protein [Caudoviricetes sp.]
MSDSIEFNVSLNESVSFNLEVGDQGPKGDKGDTGSKGETGDRGEKGDPGTTDYNQLQNRPQLDLYLKRSEANTTTTDLLNKISQNTDSINDTKSSLRNYALTSDVNGRISEAKTEVNEKISQVETRINNAISQAKIEINGKFIEADNKTSSLDTKFTKLTSDNKADIAQLRANLNFTNSALSTHKEQVDKNLDDIKVEQTDQDTLISDILNAFSVESEKGTNLKLNTSATKVLGMSIYGNTEQAKTNGYNIFRFGDMNNTLSQGIKSKMDENGYIASTGTATTDWASVTAFDSNSVLMPGTYTLSIEPSAPIRTSINGELVSNNSYKWLGAVDPGQTKVTFTVTEPIKQVRLSIRTVPNQALNIKFRPMLEAGSEAHSYEPYIGGATNLYDGVDGLPITVDGLTFKRSNGRLLCTGTATKDFVRLQEKNISDILENNNAYTIYADTATADLRLTVRLKRKDNNSYEYYNTINSQTATFTWNTSIYSEAYIYLVTGEKAFWNGSRSVASRFGLFKGGSFDSNDYAPVGMNKPTFGEIKGASSMNVLVQGKNLFDTRFGERTINGVSVKAYPDGSFELNGTPTTGFSLANTLNAKTRISDGSYKYKIEFLGGSLTKIWDNAKFIFLAYCQKDVSIQFKEPTTITGSINITGKDDYFTQYLWIPFGGDNNTAYYRYNNLRCRITLVKNDEEIANTPPFESNIFESSFGDLRLYKVGNYQDRIYTKGNKWYLEKNTATKILNGSENWIKTAELENIFICQDIINATKNYDDAYFSHFNNIKRYPNIDKTGAIRGDNGTNVAFCMNNIPNITGFKNWLNQNNVTVLYPIAQPITTEVTDSTILAELNKLMGMRTYDGTTNISITGTGLTPEIKVKYMRKIN